MSVRSPAVILAALAAAVAATSPASAATATPAQIVAGLNAVRAAHGLPSGITLNADWSDACRRHNEYMAANDTLTHDQVEGRPGYSAAGAWAGQNAVLSQGSSWTRGTVFLNAPIHLAQILSPRLETMGASESATHVCMTSWPGYREALPVAADTLYSFPGNGTRHPHLQVAAERPWTPQSRVGIPEGAATGPYLYVWWEGPSWDEEYDAEGQLVRPAQRPLEVISAAELTGPDGPVEIKLINREDVGGFIARSSGWVLPVRPLQAGALYTARVTFSTRPGGDVPRTWTGSFSFTATAARLTSYIPVPGAEVNAPRSVARSRLLRRGVAVRVRLDAAGVAVASLSAGRRLVATSRRGSVRGAGRLSLKVKPSRGMLARGMRRLTLKVGIAGAPGEAPFFVKRRMRVRG